MYFTFIYSGERILPFFLFTHALHSSRGAANFNHNLQFLAMHKDIFFIAFSALAFSGGPGIQSCNFQVANYSITYWLLSFEHLAHQWINMK